MSTYQYIISICENGRRHTRERRTDTRGVRTNVKQMEKFHPRPQMVVIERMKKTHSKQAPNRQRLDDIYFTRYTIFTKVLPSIAATTVLSLLCTTQPASWHPLDRLFYLHVLFSTENFRIRIRQLLWEGAAPGSCHMGSTRE